MSASRPRKPKTTKAPAARWNMSNMTAEQAEAFDRGISDWFETVIEPIFKEAMERQEAEERARLARPKAEIIPFPKARE